MIAKNQLLSMLLKIENSLQMEPSSGEKAFNHVVRGMEPSVPGLKGVSKEVYRLIKEAEFEELKRAIHLNQLVYLQPGLFHVSISDTVVIFLNATNSFRSRVQFILNDSDLMLHVIQCKVEQEDFEGIRTDVTGIISKRQLFKKMVQLHAHSIVSTAGIAQEDGGVIIDNLSSHMTEFVSWMDSHFKSDNGTGKVNMNQSMQYLFSATEGESCSVPGIRWQFDFIAFLDGEKESYNRFIVLKDEESGKCLIQTYSVELERKHYVACRNVFKDVCSIGRFVHLIRSTECWNALVCCQSRADLAYLPEIAIERYDDLYDFPETLEYVLENFGTAEDWDPL